MNIYKIVDESIINDLCKNGEEIVINEFNEEKHIKYNIKLSEPIN